MSRGTKDLLVNVQTQRVQRGQPSSFSSVVNGSDPRAGKSSSFSEMYEPCPPQTTSTKGGKLRPSESDEEDAAIMVSLAARGPGQQGGSVDALVQELRQKVDRQKMELDSRMDNVNAIQRNFQRLSEMYSTDREKLVAAEQEVSLLKEELAALRAEKKLSVAVRMEFAALKTEHEALRVASDKAVEESKQNAAAAKNKIALLEKEIAQLRKAVEETSATAMTLHENEQRIVHVVADLETKANGLLLSVLESQKKVCGSLASSNVGVGVGFVAPPSSSPDHKDAKGHLASPYPLRVEAVAHALQVCGEKAISVFVAAYEAALQSTADAKDFAKQQEDACSAATRDLTAQKEHVKKLQQDLQSLAQRFDDERTKLIAEVSKLTAQVSSGQKEESEALARTTGELLQCRARIEQLEQALRDSESKLVAAQTSLEKLQEDLKQKVQLAAEESASLRAERDRLAAESNSRESARNEVEQRLLSATSRINQLQDELNRSRDSLKAAQSASTSQVSQVHADLAAARRTITEMQQAAAKLELQAAELRQLKTDHEALLKTAAQANAASTSLGLQVKTLEQERDKLRQALESSTSSADQRVREAQEKLAEQEVENRMLQASLESLLRDQQEQANKQKSLREQLDAANADRDRVAKALKDVQADGSEKQELVVRLHKANSDIKQLEVKVSSLLDELRVSAAAARDLAESKLKIQSLENDLRQANEATGNARALQQLTLTQLDAMEKDKKNAEAKMLEMKATTDVILATQAAFEKTRRELEDHAGRAAARARHLRTLQEETCKTVKKLLTAEKSCESGYSCQQCLQLLKDPIMCGPCGHVYCRKCFEDTNKGTGRTVNGGKPLHCSECDMNSVTMVVPAHALDLLSGKFQYRCQVLSDLSALLDKELASAPL